MTRRWLQTPTVTFCVTLLLSGSSAIARDGQAVPAGQTREADLTRAADPDVALYIEVLAGSIRVVGWERAEVHVTGTLGNGVSGLEVDGDSAEIDIEVGLDDRHDWRRDNDNPIEASEAHLVIQVPKGADLSIETVTASIEVSDLEGPLDLESVTGAIKAHGNFSRVGVSNVNGSIEVVAIELQTGDFENVNGGILFEGGLATNSLVDLESVSGDIVLRLPADTGAEFSIESLSGKIVNEFGPEAQRARRFLPSMELDFSTGDGGASIAIESLSGNIQLLKRS